MTTQTLDDRQLQELERKYDPEMRFRPLTAWAATLVGALLILLSVFHYYTAGFGLLQEITHRGVHLAFVLGLIFLVFPHRHALLEKAADSRWHRPGSVPWFDWLLALAIAASVLYIPWIFEDLAFRVGNPGTLDVAMGSILIIALLEATRRSMGWPVCACFSPNTQFQPGCWTFRRCFIRRAMPWWRLAWTRKRFCSGQGWGSSWPKAASRPTRLRGARLWIRC